jgi:hypothetical protein
MPTVKSASSTADAARCWSSCTLCSPSAVAAGSLLTLAALDAFDVAWSEEILEELRRNVIADHPDIDPDRFATHTLGAMRSAFPEANVTGYEHLTARLDSDPKDRHVAAVALSCAASPSSLSTSVISAAASSMTQGSGSSVPASSSTD